MSLLHLLPPLSSSLSKEFIQDYKMKFQTLVECVQEKKINIHYDLCQLIAEFASTKYLPCLCCGARIGGSECIDDFSMDNGPAPACFDENDQIRFFINSEFDVFEPKIDKNDGINDKIHDKIDAMNRGIHDKNDGINNEINDENDAIIGKNDNKPDEPDEDDIYQEIICIQCSLQWKCRFCGLQALEYNEAESINNCDKCLRIMCVFCATDIQFEDEIPKVYCPDCIQSITI